MPRKSDKPKTPKKRGTWGLYARNFPKSVRWKVDQDYLNHLSPDDRMWLARFNDHFYGADFRTDTDGEWPVPERRVAYRQKASANNDVYAVAQENGLMIPDDDLPRRDVACDYDITPTPEYLNSPEYKDAVATFRSLLPEDRRVRSPKITSRLDLAARRIRKVMHDGEDE